MDRYKDLEDMICDEIDRIADQKTLNGSTLEMLDKLTHTLKSIKTVEAMDGYSEGYYGDSMSYARKRDSMGRYSNDGRYERHDGRYNEGRYSGRY